MGNKKTKPTNPEPPKTQRHPKLTTPQLTPSSSKYQELTMSVEAQKHLAAMHKIIDEMLAEIQRDKIERKTSRSSKKQKPVGGTLVVLEEDEEDHELFTKLYDMVVRDQYITTPGNQGNDNKSSSKGKGKLKVKTGEGEEGEIEAPLRSPQECYPYCI